MKQQIAPSVEPRYDEVAIPKGYAAVYQGQLGHAQAQAAMPQPYVQPPYPSMPGMPYQGHPQQWMNVQMMPGVMQGQMTPTGLPPHMAQGTYQPYPPYQGTPPPVMMSPYAPPQQYNMPGQPSVTPPAMQGHTPPAGQGQGHVLPSGAPVQHPLQYPIQQQQTQQQMWQDPAQAFVAGQVQQFSVHQQVGTPVNGTAAQQQPPASSSDHFQTAPTTPVPLAQPPQQQQFAVLSDDAAASPFQARGDHHPQLHQQMSVNPKHDPVPSQIVASQNTFAVEGTSEHGQLVPPSSTGGNLIPQRQISAASQVSSLTTEAATSKGSPDTQKAQVDHPVLSPTPQPEARRLDEAPQEEAQEHPETPIIHRVTLKDEPLPKADTPVTATPADKDDIYGATPRQPAGFSPQPQQLSENGSVVSGTPQESSSEPDSKFAGMPPTKVAAAAETKPDLKVVPPAQQGFAIEPPPVFIEQPTATPKSAEPSMSPGAIASLKSTNLDDEPPSPTESELHPKKGEGKNENSDEAEAAAAVAAMNGKPVQSSAEIFEEHKRKQLIRDMEEKIALMPTEPEEMASLEPPRRNEEIPVMSATSYPGQEWNPYGDGFEDDDE